jgi:hypothetical protein
MKVIFEAKSVAAAAPAADVDEAAKALEKVSISDGAEKTESNGGGSV